MLAILVSALPASASPPALSLSTDYQNQLVAIGELCTWSATITCLAPDPIYAALWSMALDPCFALEQVTATDKILNSFTLSWSWEPGGTRYSAVSPTTTVYVDGREIPAQVDAQGKVRIQLGDMQPGETRDVEIKARRTW